MSQNKKLSLEHFEDVLNKAYDQVAVGKGKQRHGNAKAFADQPWKLIADTVGPEFLTGQAVKKLMELSTHKINETTAIEQSRDKEADICRQKWMTDALGAIVYTVMAIMYKEHQISSETKKEDKEPELWLSTSKTKIIEEKINLSLGTFVDD